MGRSPRRTRLIGATVGAAIALVVGAVLAVPWVVAPPAAPDVSDGAPTAPAPPTTAGVPTAPDATPTGGEGGRPSRTLVPPAAGVYFGVSNFGIVSDDGAAARWQRSNGIRPAIVNWYQQWLTGERRFRADWARRVARAGAVPMITWEPWSAPAGELHTVDQPDIALARIAGGDHDAHLRAWARDVAAYGQPVLIRLMHEMNGTWYPWGVHVNGNAPADYVRAWRHVHRIFARAGADNVSWVWSINNLERVDGEDHDIDAYYPGRRYVDWVATSGFNWGEAYEWSSWRTADALYRDTYRQLARFDRPIMISEIGTTAVGGDPRTWIRQTFRRLRTGYPLLRAVLWYDDIDGAGLDFRLQGPIEGALDEPGVLGRDWIRAPRLRAI